MLVKDFITEEIPVLKGYDTGDYALALMDKLKLKQLPVVSGSAYKALISEKELLAIDNTFLPLETLVGNSGNAPSIYPNRPVLDALAYIVRQQLSLIPVISEKKEYIGSVTLETLCKELSELCGAETPGSTIVLELKTTDYSLSDIARILESNRAHLISMLSTPHDGEGKIRLMLKTDLEDASPLVRSFERFNYTVLFHFMKHGMIDDMLQQRVNELFLYMNI